MWLILLLIALPSIAFSEPTTMPLGIAYEEPKLNVETTATTLKASHSNKCVYVKSGGAGMVQIPCNGSSSLIWYPNDIGGNVYTLSPGFDRSKCLDLDGPQFTDGTPLKLNICDAAKQTQQWIMQPSPGYIIANAGASPEKCLNVNGASLGDDVPVTIWDCLLDQAPILHATFSYDPPSQKPLTDLAGTKIYVDILNDGADEIEITKPASALTGGGTIEHHMDVAIPDDQQTYVVNIQSSAFDVNGNESHRTGIITKTFKPIDVIAPDPPGNLRFTNIGGSP